jgi:hypothetical protein
MVPPDRRLPSTGTPQSVNPLQYIPHPNSQTLWQESQTTRPQRELVALLKSGKPMQILDVYAFTDNLTNEFTLSKVCAMKPETLVRGWPTPYTSWMSYIPSRMGWNQALDRAVELLLTTFRALIEGGGDAADASDENAQKETGERVVRASRRNYVDALKALQECISGPEALAAETLCATLLLGMYEVRLCPPVRLVSSLRGLVR